MLWIVGKAFSELEQYLTSHKVEYGVFTDALPKQQSADAATILQVDFSSEAALYHSLDALTDKPVVTAVITSGYEQYVLPSSWLAKYYDVPGVTPDTAIA